VASLRSRSARGTISLSSIPSRMESS
jgi:hypothetical protein